MWRTWQLLSQNPFADHSNRIVAQTSIDDGKDKRDGRARAIDNTSDTMRRYRMQLRRTNSL